MSTFPPTEPTPAPVAPREDGATGDSESARRALLAVRAEVAKAVVGQDAAVSGILIALLSRGHILLEGVPGVAKTLLVRSLAQALSVQTTRVQFTPDLMPGDITGSLVFDQHNSTFSFREGPVFTNLLLADEINRTPPKTQAALLEAMQERRVTLDGTAHPLPSHFLVVATQNPIESQGVYPLPEAQLDRFLFKLLVAYPSVEEEVRIVSRFGDRSGLPTPGELGIATVADRATLDAACAALSQVRLAESIIDYIVRLVRATRESADLACGASPRAAVLLAGASRARAALEGRDYVVPDDVKALATSLLRHRLLLSPAAEIEGRQVEALVAELVEQTEAPR